MTWLLTDRAQIDSEMVSRAVAFLSWIGLLSYDPWRFRHVPRWKARSVLIGGKVYRSMYLRNFTRLSIPAAQDEEDAS